MRAKVTVLPPLTPAEMRERFEAGQRTFSTRPLYVIEWEDEDSPPPDEPTIVKE